MRRKRYFHKMLLTYIVPSVFFILVAGGLLGYFYTSSLRRESDLQTRTYLNQVAQNIDYTVEIFRSTSEKLMAEPEFSTLVQGGPGMYGAAVKSINVINNHLLNSSTRGVFAVMSENAPFVLAQTGTQPFSNFVQEMGLDKKQQEYILKMLKEPSDNSFILVSREDGEERNDERLLFLQQEEVEPGNFALFLFLFPRQYLLPNGAGFMGPTTIMNWKDPENWPKNADTYMIEGLVEYIKHGSKSEAGFYETGDAWYYTRKLNYLPGYTAVIAVSQKDISRNVASKLLLTFCICIVLLGAFVLLAYFMTKSMYKPIRAITQMFYDIDNGGTAEKEEDEFDYIKTAGEHVKDLLHAQKITLRLKFLHDLLYGMAKREEIVQNIEQFGLQQYDNEACTVGIVMLANEAELEEGYSEDDVASIKNQTVRLFFEHLSKTVSFESVQMDARNYAVILRTDRLPEFAQMVEEILEDINLAYGIELVCFLGEEAPSIREIHTSYESALRMQSFFINDTGKLVYLPEDLRGNDNMYYYPIDLERNLIHAVLHQNRTDMEFILKHIIRENLVKRKLSNERFKEFLFSLAVTANRILHMMNKSIGEVFEEDVVFYLEFQMAETNGALKSKIEEIFETLYCASARDEEFSGSFKEQLLTFMEQNYTKDVSLSELAEYFGLSESHMSKKFKSCMGDTFKNYFNMFRIEKAKEILAQNPDIPIYRLSERLGFTNSNSFIRTFKRYTGVSPSKYKSE